MPTSTITAAQLADLLAATARDEWYDAHCPAHDDERPSFSFRDGPDGLIVHCHAGCKPDAILTALRKEYPSARFKRATSHGGASKQIAVIYPYENEQGQLREPETTCSTRSG
jgi:hypothetical protein